ncbi:ketopantoate reductase family protein [Isoptericola variabilis]|uniref:2-dehydropantoate 2-reductase n=1 Tax=Isoptericola variabilis (strain 225) TaxID=743718 RepID=F6FPM8_ISOV2|nr:2-dehydropantoate 2-reductase [Isoptericola variabilis]AEG44760.1 2-dehydropantoate 2-reductase [Isoptericola variabilis 225]TWH32373.1 2-dehydropantoate 2-reductase [Isoptericola variabilis J7]
MTSPDRGPAPAGDPRNPVIAVVGPGAIGGLVAAFLQRARHEVVLVGRERTARRVAEHGLEIVTDRFGSWHAPLHATTAVPRGARVVVAVKAEGVPAAAELVAAARPTEVVALLNGLEHMNVLRRAVRDGRPGAPADGPPVVGATIAGETLRTGHDHGGDTGALTVRHRGDLLRVVVPDAAADLHVVRALRDTGIEVTTGGTEAEVLWKKLRFLAPHALLTSTWRSGVGDALDADPALAAALLAEVAAVATAEGVPTTGDELLGILRGFHRTMRSSLQADLEAGRPGELDAIGGAVARRAAAHGIATPVLDELLGRLAARVSRR